MMRTTSIVILVLAMALCSASMAEQKKIFTARIVDGKGVESLVTEVSTCSRSSSYWYFRCRKGEAEVELDFDRVSSVTFIGADGQPLRGYRAAEVTLVSGRQETLYFSTIWTAYEWWNQHGLICGRDVDLGSDVTFRVMDLSSIQFLHDGTYKKCPICGTYFYDTKMTHCHFDSARLEPQPKE